MKKVLEMDAGDGCATVWMNVLDATELSTYKTIVQQNKQSSKWLGYSLIETPNQGHETQTIDSIHKLLIRPVRRLSQAVHQ